MNSIDPFNESPVPVGENFSSIRNNRAKRNDIIPLSLHGIL